MAEGERERTHEREFDDVADVSDVSNLDVTDDAPAVEIPDSAIDDDSATDTNAARAWLAERTGQILTKQSMTIALAVTVVGALVFGALVPFGIVGNLVGVLVAGFLYGAATDRRRYAELGLAGGAVGGVIALLGNLTLTLFGPGVPLVAVGAGGGLLAGLLGHYFGRDLRDGLTRDL